MSGYLAWSHYNSYRDVSFSFDYSKGKANLSSTDSGRIDIDDNQTIRLKKGEYTLNTSGENIENKSKTIQIDDESKDIKVNFNYTLDFLQKIYQKEEPKILSDLYSQYPKIKSLYSVSGGAVYEKGQYYGAKLIYNQEKYEHRDSLRVLMKKNSHGQWKVISNPPMPILSSPDYPDIQPETLESINRAK